MVRYLDTRGGAPDAKERGKLLFWFAQGAMWGPFSGPTESYIDQDLAALEGADGGLDKVLEQLWLWHGLGIVPARVSARGLIQPT